MRVTRCLLVALTVLLSSLTASSAAAAPGDCTDATEPCLAVSSVPDSVSVTTVASTTYVRYEAVVFNGGGSTMSQIVVRHAIPASTSLVSGGLTTTQGTCDTTKVSCALGSLAAGASATVAVTVTGPSSVGSGEITDTVDATFSAGGNPGSDPKVNRTASASTAVTATAGFVSTWVLPGETTTITTDRTRTGTTPTQSEVAAMRIPATSTGVSASLERGPELTPSFTCPKKEVCRDGEWIRARGEVGGVPAFFLDPPLRISLRWDKTVVPKRQTVSNLSIFYAEELIGPVQTISRRCLSSQPATSELPCLTNVVKLPDGDFAADLFRDHNGYMR